MLFRSPGSIFGEWLDRIQVAGQITKVEAQKAFPLYTAWDLGRTDATAIWFYQLIADEIHIVDYFAATLKDIPFYADLLREKAVEHGCTYARHWVPHDARARTLASGGKSIQQQLIEQRVGNVSVAKRLDHLDGIQAARATIPRCWFDEKRCAQGIEALRNYHYEWDEVNRKFTDMPKHDWSSDGASAYRTLALSWKMPRPEEGPQAPISDLLIADGMKKFNFGVMKKAHFARMRRSRSIQ